MKSLIIFSVLLAVSTAFAYGDRSSELECSELSDSGINARAVSISCVSKASIEKDKLQIKLIKLQIKKLEAELKQENKECK